MEIITTADGWMFLFRWLHFLAGITWIGILYYFNFLQTPFFGSELGGSAKSAITRGLVPNALWWFRWGAMFTIISGLAIIAIRLHQGVTLGDPYMTKILTGGLMGTFMWANVWFVIWPIQKMVIANAETVASGGEANPDAAARAPRAGTASRTNTLFSLPMLFFMGSSSHLAAFDGMNDELYWIGTQLVVLAVEANIFFGTAATKKPLATVSGTIHGGLALTVLLYVWGVIVL